MAEHELIQKWLAVFGRDVDENTITSHVTSYGNLLWHLFTWGGVACLEGDEARAAFDQLEYTEAIRFVDGYSGHIEGIEPVSKVSAKALDKDRASDVYIVAGDFSWTYVRTHEIGLGPYLCFRRQKKAAVLPTPFGTIRILADGAPIDFAAQPFDYLRPPVKDHPIAGCYRVYVPTGGYRSIRCVLDTKRSDLIRDGSSGERYLCKDFIAGTMILTIGAEDENPAFEAVRLENGMEYCIKAPVDAVPFGIAWSLDYEGYTDVRTWFAADPTVLFIGRELR